jgi:signal transduction histidine kinase
LAHLEHSAPQLGFMEPLFRILILEDSQLDYELLVRHFKSNAAFTVNLRHAETRDEFERALKEPWDAVLSDFNVPGFGAMPALETIKKKGLDLPLIVVSGEVGEENAVEIMHAGADDFIRKDNLARLIPSIERSIGVSQMRKRKAKLRIEHERALRDRERLMDIVCHDIKNPLTSVRLSSQLLLKKADASEMIESAVVKESLEDILRSAERVNRLVQDLLDQSRIESGLLSIKPGEVSVSDLLVECIEVFRPIAENSGVGLKPEIPESDFRGYFDRDRIFQVISNLFTNALKFSPRQSSIIIGATQTDDKARFFVKDFGPGIAAEEKDFIFSKFFQGKTQKVKGHGLGLWIAHEIVRTHGGDIGFDKNPEDSGTTFWFTVPLSGAIAEKPATRRGAFPKILVVDDDEDLTDVLCKVLNEKDISCKTADNYETAIHHLQDESWRKSDLVLIDYDLPGKNGGELAQWMRYHIPPDKLPRMILMSAHPDIHERAEALNVDLYLKKPMNLDEILGLI